MEGRHAAASWSSLQHGRMPGPPTRKTRAEVLEEILMAMRNTSTITEVPLGMFLRSQSLLLTAPQRQGQDLNVKVSLSWPGPGVQPSWE